jgi:hypothetical protein
MVIRWEVERGWQRHSVWLVLRERINHQQSEVGFISQIAVIVTCHEL